MIYHTLIKLSINQSDYNIITYLCNNRKMNSYNVNIKALYMGGTAERHTDAAVMRG